LRPYPERQGEAPDPIGPRLDGEVSGDRRGLREAQGQDDLCRRRTLRRPTGWCDLLRDHAAGLGQRGGHLTYFAFDLLELEGEDIARLPLLERKNQLAALLGTPPAGIEYSDHEGGEGEVFPARGLPAGLEGIVSKRLDRPYLPGDRGAWIKTKCLNRAEFVVVGWSDPEGSRPYVGALLLGYFEPDGRLVYAVRVGTGMSQKTLATLHKRVQPRAQRCPSPLPRLATTGSGGRWSWPRFIGSGPNWSPKSLI
jgi:ATP-dependent DNA ligase